MSRVESPNEASSLTRVAAFSARTLKAFSARVFRESTLQETFAFDRILAAAAWEVIGEILPRLFVGKPFAMAQWLRVPSMTHRNDHVLFWPSILRVDNFEP